MMMEHFGIGDQLFITNFLKVLYCVIGFLLQTPDALPFFPQDMSRCGSEEPVFHGKTLWNFIHFTNVSLLSRC
jgi:hypothetical protein